MKIGVNCIKMGVHVEKSKIKSKTYLHFFESFI